MELETLVSDVVTPMRMNRGVDSDATSRLDDFLRQLIADARGQQDISKRVAFLLHELMTGIESSIPLYGESEAQEVGAFLVQFDELIRELYTS